MNRGILARLKTWLDGAIETRLSGSKLIYAYDPQSQDTGIGFAPPEKVKVPLLAQGILEIVTDTD